VRKLADYLADQHKRDQDDRDLTSRSDLRKVQKEAEMAYAELSQSLCDCSDKQLRRLELPELLRQVVLEARSIVSPSAKDRALRLVRRELRSGDAEAVRRQLDNLNKPNRSALPNNLETWLARLTSEGETALNEFIDAHARADRQQLRRLVRNVHKAKDANRTKALVALSKLISTVILDSVRP
jgi:ribosome-associated protein